MNDCFCAAGDIAEPMGIEIRGSTSARDFSKKSFALEIRDENGDDKDINLLGTCFSKFLTLCLLDFVLIPRTVDHCLSNIVLKPQTLHCMQGYIPNIPSFNSPQV